MSKYSSIKKVIIKQKEFYVHTNMLSKLPFFEDFIESNNDEIKIEYDDVDDNIIDLFIDNLYGVPIKKIECVELFKLFKFADFLCVNLVCFQNGDVPKTDLLKYVYEKKDIDALLKFQKWFNIEFSVEELLVVAADDDFIMQVKTSFTITDLNSLLDNKKHGLVVKVFRDKPIVYPNDFSIISYWFHNKINNMLDSNEDIEYKKEIIEYISANKNLLFKISLFLEGSKNKVIEQYKEKLKNIS